MQADMDELVHIRFTGKMLDLLLEIDPKICTVLVWSWKGDRG
jgi:hypothetical protein